jgi:hypothetical protein
MAWVLYAPEDGSKAASVECWIPFALKWDLPQSQRDGFIFVEPMVCAMDARSTSARKLMVRANIGAIGEAIENAEEQLFAAESLPGDVQLLQRSYPMMLPLEYGEKLFDLEEELPWTEGTPLPDKVLRYQIEPEVLEYKIMAGRLIFRGNAQVYMLCQGEDGTITNWQCELPFSQYAQLDRDYSSSADANIQLVLTAADIQRDENNQMILKCQVAGQYVVFDRVMVDLTEDAYSTIRELELQKKELQLPQRLDRVRQEVMLTGEGGGVAGQILDVFCMTENVQKLQNGNEVQITIPAKIQVLYIDENGALQSCAISAQGKFGVASASDNDIRIKRKLSHPYADKTADNIRAEAKCMLDIDVYAEQGNTMVIGVQLGEVSEPDPNRPSLILRSCGEEQLWDIAKKCGTTVDAIRTANQLTQEPEKGQMLLIPVP